MLEVGKPGLLYEEKPFIITPDVNKEFFKTAFYIAMIFLLLVGIIIYLQIQVGLDFLVDTFATFGYELSGGDMALVCGAIFLLFALTVLLFNYLNIKNVKYEIYKNRIMHSETQALFMILKQEIPFTNITRITLSKDGVINKLLNCGEITIELTGLRIKEVKLLSIDNVDQVTQYLQQLLYEFNAQRQMQYQEEKKVEGIMDKF